MASTEPTREPEPGEPGYIPPCFTDAHPPLEPRPRATHLADEHGCSEVPICEGCIALQRDNFSALVRRVGDARCSTCGREGFTEFDQFVQIRPYPVPEGGKAAS